MMKDPQVRVLLIGAQGRMGKAIVDLAEHDAKIEIVARCDLGDAIEPAMKNSDVAIDFSQPDVIEEICRAAMACRRALVIGTTGHSPTQQKMIQDSARSVPLVLASNFSVGVNVLFWLTSKAAELLGNDFKPTITETHHKLKKDAPSGTAKTLGEIVKRARKIESDVPIQSIREGDIVGEHTVIFSGPGERLELTHRAASREIFARGALQAAKWSIGKPAGLYTMQDVLGLLL